METFEQLTAQMGSSGFGSQTTQIQWILLIVIGLVGWAIQARLQAVFRKYSRVPFADGLTGREVAEKMLRDNNITSVEVVSTKGTLTDHYNPATRKINLSQGVYDSNSVAAAAVAAHETGHAVQHAQGYAWLRMRGAMAPFISFTSKWVFIVLIIGIVVAPIILWVGISLMALAVIFSIVTLPVEFNASARALSWLRGSGMLSTGQLAQAKTALSWAASTYVVAAVSSIATLLYYISIANSRR